MTRLLALVLPAGLLMLHGAPPAAPSYSVRAASGGHARLMAGHGEAWQPAATLQWGPAPYETTFRALWTARGLCLRFDAADHEPWFTMTKRDTTLPGLMTIAGAHGGVGPLGDEESDLPPAVKNSLRHAAIP